MRYNAGEILEIAQQIERNGARFYEAVAERSGGGREAVLLQDLAAMERSHERTFADMADELAASARGEPFYDPNAEAGEYLRAVASGKVFDLRADPVEWLAGAVEFGRMLEKAITLEKDSIIFYLGIRDAVPGELGGARVEDIIREEMAHVVSLHELLASGRD